MLVGICRDRARTKLSVKIIFSIIGYIRLINRTFLPIYQTPLLLIGWINRVDNQHINLRAIAIL
jgi:hypothetical protein